MNVFEERIEAAVKVIERYGGIDGARHKQWVLDQVVRKLLAHKYHQWVEKQNEDEDYVPWDTGIAP